MVSIKVTSVLVAFLMVALSMQTVAVSGLHCMTPSPCTNTHACTVTIVVFDRVASTSGALVVIQLHMLLPERGDAKSLAMLLCRGTPRLTGAALARKILSTAAHPDVLGLMLRVLGVCSAFYSHAGSRPQRLVARLTQTAKTVVQVHPPTPPRPVLSRYRYIPIAAFAEHADSSYTEGGFLQDITVPASGAINFSYHSSTHNLFVGSSKCAFTTEICPSASAQMISASSPCKYTPGKPVSIHGLHART